MILFCRAPTPEGPWQICVQKLDGDDGDFVTLTKAGSNLLPDWHALELSCSPLAPFSHQSPTGAARLARDARGACQRQAAKRS